jgi:hypothetical protein
MALLIVGNKCDSNPCWHFVASLNTTFIAYYKHVQGWYSNEMLNLQELTPY